MTLEKCQFKQQRDITTHPSERPNWRMTTPNVGPHVFARIAGGNTKWYRNLGGQLNGVLRNETYSYTILQTWYVPKDENFCPHKNLHMDVVSSFIQSCQNLEAAKMSFSR